MEERLIFLLGAPRSGTTLLARILSAHSAIYGRAEPHLITPLAHLGYYASVQKAPYDPFNVQQAIHEFVDDLPRGEADYLDALRAYADTLYGRMLDASGKRYFLDKTPAYSLVLPFLTKLYPQARYIVLTRHPLAIQSSYVNSFFDGEWEVALNHNPILDRYVPALAKVLRDRPVDLHHVRYEEFVADPVEGFRSICSYLDLSFEESAIEYQSAGEKFDGLGDPTGVEQHGRPVTSSVEGWAAEIAADPKTLELACKVVDGLASEDLETLGYPREVIVKRLDEAAGAGIKPRSRKAPLRYSLQRKVLVRVRKNIHDNLLGRLLKRLRFALDVVLRE